ncbi:MAG: hypothetical protein M1820_005432 [Bogoriella megaspora]|nr:MAG: hypothetical protein M1820_005432 [Bogoriella megaspora]
MGDSVQAVPQLHPQKTRRSSKPRRQKRSNSQQNGHQIGNPSGNGFISDGHATPPRHTNYDHTKPVPMSAQPAMETPMKQAYAGPTFHASPAASSLPVPRFVSKSVPAQAEQGSLQARLNEESDKSEDPASSSGSTPKLAPTEPARVHQPSPLDFLLDADRQEKARVGSENGMRTPDRNLNRNYSSDSGQPSIAPEAVPERPLHHSRTPSNNSGMRGMFPMELDGTQTTNSAGTPDRPRMLSSRSTTDPNKVHQISGMSSADAAKSLMDLLGVPNSTRSPPNVPNNSFNPTSVANTSPQLRRNHSSNSSLPFSSGSPTPPIPLTPPNNIRPGPGNATFHYGNRNLSPLFQAARNTPPINPHPNLRPSSSLRQEIAQEPPSAPAELPATNASPLHSPTPPSASAPLNSTASTPVAKADPSSGGDARANSISKAYLDAQIHTASPGTIPPISLPPRQGSGSGSGSASGVLNFGTGEPGLGREASPFHSPTPPQRGTTSSPGQQGVFVSPLTSRQGSGVGNQVEGNLGSSKQSGGTDIKAMEDNLRKMLNLHTLGGEGGGV